MKGTRLWTEAGSPLIQGRSRMHRPLWREWLAASFGAAALAAPVVYVLLGRSVSWSPVELVAGTLVAALVLSWPIVWLVRKLGARHAWRGSAVITACLAPLALFLYRYVSVIALGK